MILNRAHCPRRRGPSRPRLETLEGRTLLSVGDTNDLLIQGSATRALYNVDGAGEAAALIDTGVDYTHQAFGPDPNNNFGLGKKVEDGYDFSNNSTNPYSSAQHGTSTAGIVASSSSQDPGVAPGANIVELKVFGSDGTASFSRVVSALQYVVNHHAADNITVVNLSLSDGGNYSADYFSKDFGTGQQIATLIKQLDTLNIPVVVASGNSFNGQGMGFPAILTDTISVTGSNEADQLMPDAQRLGTAVGGAAATDLAAPGNNVLAPTHDNEFERVSGTSYAAPEVTGAVLLLQQIYRQRFGTLPTVANLESWLKQGAVQIHDSVTGINIGRLNIANSAALIPQNTPPPPPAPQTPIYVNNVLNATIPTTSVINPLAGFTDATGKALSFSQVTVYSTTGATSTIKNTTTSGTSAAASVDVYIPQGNNTGGGFVPSGSNTITTTPKTAGSTASAVSSLFSKFPAIVKAKPSAVAKSS